MVTRDPRKRAQRQQQSSLGISPSLTSAAVGPQPPRQRLVVGSLLPALMLGGKLAWPRAALLVDYTIGGDDRPPMDAATGKPDAVLATARAAIEQQASGLADWARRLLYPTDASELCVMHVLPGQASCGEVRLTLTAAGSRGNHRAVALGGRRSEELPTVMGG